MYQISINYLTLRHNATTLSYALSCF